MSRAATMNPETQLPVAGVSHRSADGWAKFRSTHRLSYAALIEAIGLWMADHADTPIGDLGPNERWVIDKAREVQAERRRRKPDQPDDPNSDA